VSFTGSTAVGKSAMHNAADTMQRVTLELGGKSAHIALDGANVEQAGVKDSPSLAYEARMGRLKRKAPMLTNDCAIRRLGPH
jgi:hypothetical protein